MRTDVGSDLVCNLLADTGVSSNQLTHICVSDDVAPPSNSDVMPLAGELDRLAATITHTVGTNELVFTATFTAGADVTVSKAGLTDNSTPGDGVLAFVSLLPVPLDLLSGESYGQSITVALA